MMLIGDKKIQVFKWLFQYFITFCALCTANHCLSLAIFEMCGYCLYTYTLIYICLLVAFSLLLSCAVHNILVRRGEKYKLLEELRAVKFEDIPHVMICLINKSKEREAQKLHAHQNEITPESELCVACYENKPSIRNVPCRHSVLCRSCNWNMLRVSIENRTPLICPWCRMGITEFCGEMRPDLTSLQWVDIKWALKELETLKSRRRRGAGTL